MQLIILDRDGVINNDLGTYVTHPDEFVFATGAIDAIVNFKKAGHLVAIATNQGGIARGRYSHENLAAIHAKMLGELRAAGGDIDRIVYCPAYDNAHPWRKPNAGMLNELLRGFAINAADVAENVVFIGDAVRDMQAGATIGCRLIKVKDRHEQTNAEEMATNLRQQVTFTDNLATAAQQLLTEKSPTCY